MMFRTQKQIFSIMASSNANAFIYYFKRIPYLGKILPDSIYGNMTTKKIVAGIAMVLKMLGRILGRALILGFLTVFPFTLNKESTLIQPTAYIHVFMMINLFGSFLISSISDANRNKFICIRLMRMDAKDYIVSSVLYMVLVDFIASLPVVLIATLWMKGTALQGFILSFYAMIFTLLGEAFFLRFYTKTKIMLSKKTAYVIIVGVLTFVSAYLPVLLHRPIPFDKVLFNPLLIIGLIILGALSIYVIRSSDMYHEIAVKTLKSSNYIKDANQIKAEATFKDVAVREKEFSESDLHSTKYDSKSGFAYLNAIFFERHKRLMVKPIVIRLCIVAALFVAAVVFSIFVPEFTEVLEDSGRLLPVFVFIMYFASIGERVCKAMFYNCDISLLRYQFYRERNAVLSNFKVRLSWIAGLNFIVAAAISIAVVSLVLIFKVNWSTLDTISFVFSIFVLSLFFSVHHLFLYYVFQPYTTEAGLKNPFYSIINFAVYILCYFSSQIQSPPAYFTLIVLASTIIYIIVALILVYKYATKTFRVK